MRKTVKIITILILSIGFMSCTEAQSSNTNKELSQQLTIHENIDAKEFKSKLKEKNGTLLDVRTLNEVNEGKIEEALHIDYYASDFIAQVEKLDKNKPVYVYCASGGRSRGAMNKIQEIGFTEIYNLNGGIGAWKRSGFTIVK